MPFGPGSTPKHRPNRSHPAPEARLHRLRAPRLSTAALARLSCIRAADREPGAAPARPPVRARGEFASNRLKRPPSRLLDGAGIPWCTEQHACTRSPPLPRCGSSSSPASSSASWPPSSSTPGTPGNMGVCVACFLRDIAGSFGGASLGMPRPPRAALTVAAPAARFPRPSRPTVRPIPLTRSARLAIFGNVQRSGFT